MIRSDGSLQGALPNESFLRQLFAMRDNGLLYSLHGLLPKQDFDARKQRLVQMSGAAFHAVRETADVPYRGNTTPLLKKLSKLDNVYFKRDRLPKF